VDMWHGLPGFGASIEDHPVPRLVDSLRHRYGVGLLGELFEQPVPGASERDKVTIVACRNYQYMNRSLRVDIAERHRARTLQHPSCRDVTGGDATEKALCHAADLNLYPAWPAADIYGWSTANPRRPTPLVHDSAAGVTGRS
jgi:hypothetical protein